MANADTLHLTSQILAFSLNYDPYCRDYRGALTANLEPRLLRRPGEWSEGAKQESEDVEQLEKKGIRVIRSLRAVVEEVERRNSGRG